MPAHFFPTHLLNVAYRNYAWNWERGRHIVAFRLKLHQTYMLALAEQWNSENKMSRYASYVDYWALRSKTNIHLTIKQNEYKD